MIIVIVGELGRGKTLTMTYLLLKDKVLRNRTIYTNYKCIFADRILYFPKELLEVKNGSVGLDEGWLWIHSRASHSMQNKVINHILLASRKLDLDIYITSQSFKQLDAWVRRITDVVILPTFINENKCYIDYYNPDMIFIKREKFCPKPIFNLYNTKEIIPQVSIFKIIKLIENDNEVINIIKEYDIELATEFISEKYAINKNQAKAIIKYLKKKKI